MTTINLSQPLKLNNQPIQNLKTQFDSQYQNVWIIKPDGTEVLILTSEKDVKTLPFKESWMQDALMMSIMGVFSSHGIETSGYKVWNYENESVLIEKLGNIVLKIQPKSDKGVKFYQAKFKNLVESASKLGEVIVESIKLFPPEIKLTVKENKVKADVETLDLFSFA